VMRAPLYQTFGLTLRPLRQQLDSSDSSTHIFSRQRQEFACKPTRRRRHNLDPVGRRQLGHEVGLASVQAGRGPPVPIVVPRFP